MFGNDEQLSLATRLTHTPILKQHIISEKFDVLFADVLFLFGFEVLDKYKKG